MNEVNVGVQVPQTTQNASASSNTPVNAQTQTGQSSTALTPSPGQKVIVNPREEAGLALVGIILFLVVIVLLILIFRDQLIKRLRKFF